MSVTHDDVTRAARTMIDVEPPSGLEARIAARLDAVTPAATPRRWPWVAALATAATLTLIVTQFRSSEEMRSRVPEVQQSRVPEVQQSAVHLPIPSSAHLPISTPVRLPAYRTISESELAWMARRVPALEPIESIQPEPVWIAPLSMAPLMTSPMYGDIDEGRQ